MLSVDIEVAPTPVPLEPIIVTATRLPEVRGTMLDGFLERQYWLGDRLGLGTFIDREAIEARNPAHLSDLFRTIPGVRFRRTSMSGSLPVVGRELDCESSQIYLDGVLVIRARDVRHVPRNLWPIDEDVDILVPPSMLAGVEVYRGGAQVPPEYGGSAARCGVIALWTQRGR